MLHKIVNYPSTFLTYACHQVISFDDTLKLLVNDLVETMYTNNGVGIAAPQIGVMQKVVIIDPSVGEVANQLLVLINPRVTWRSCESVTETEGCLSLPGVMLNVLRPQVVDVVYNDIMGVEKQIRCTNLVSRIVQHEIDHLHGIVMLDRVGNLARNIAMKDLGMHK